MSGGVLFGFATVLLIIGMVIRVDSVYVDFGEAVVSGGWILSLIGVIGVAQRLSDTTQWLVRTALVSASVGIAAFSLFAVSSLSVVFTGRHIELFSPIFIVLGSFIGSLLAFGTVSLATLRSPDGSRVPSILLVLPALLFTINAVVLPQVIGQHPKPPEIEVLLTSSLAVTMVAMGIYTQSGTHQPHTRNP